MHQKRHLARTVCAGGRCLRGVRPRENMLPILSAFVVLRSSATFWFVFQASRLLTSSHTKARLFCCFVGPKHNLSSSVSKESVVVTTSTQRAHNNHHHYHHDDTEEDELGRRRLQTNGGGVRCHVNVNANVNDETDETQWVTVKASTVTTPKSNNLQSRQQRCEPNPTHPFLEESCVG